MSPRGWGVSFTRVMPTAAVLLSFLSSPVAANPVSTPFDFAFEIAIFNFPINGFILLLVYFTLIKRGAHAMYFGPRNFAIIFLMCTAIISFTGGIVDSAAYMTLSIPVFIVATALIGMIAGIVAYRFLRLDFEASWVVGVVFFTVNLISWSLLASDAIIDIAYDYCAAIGMLFLAFLATLILLAMEHQGGTRARRYGAKPAPSHRPYLPEAASSYPVKVRHPDGTEETTGIVVESIVAAGCCLSLLVFAYSIWLF